MKHFETNGKRGQMAIVLALALSGSLALAGCANLAGTSATESATVAATETPAANWEPIPEEAVIAATEEPEDEGPKAYELQEGEYFSELTGEPISTELQMQRPIAVMIDDDERAQPHFGTKDADIVYEMMNSTANNRITRLMAMYKDWNSVDKIGSIRSVRPTNILLAQEYDAVICHDGGPFYINDYLSRYNYHFSGTFSRVDNGKDREFTEFILPGDLDKNFADSGYSKEYKEVPEPHFKFVPYGLEADLEPMAITDDVRPAKVIGLPFPHNSTQLIYNEDTRQYELYEYGEKQIDGDADTGMSFDNVILQCCDFRQYDEHGYLIYDCININMGYYITRGELVSIKWKKDGESAVTRFYDADDNEIAINTGKTYIALIPSDSFSTITTNE